MSKLRPIRTATRAASVKRKDVTSAVRSVMVSRSSVSGRFVMGRENPVYGCATRATAYSRSKKSSAKKRK